MSGRKQSRRFQCYGVGTGKTGTQSLAGIFARNCRSAHEPQCPQLVSLVLDVACGKTSRDAVRDFLVARDDQLELELESDGTLWHFLPELIELFPESQFILTIRDCYSWLDSVFDHNVNVDPEGFWGRFDDLSYAAWDFEHEPEEEILKERGLRTLGHYLSHWASHNQTVIDTTPCERLLVVRTDRIRETIPAMEVFLGLPEGTLDPRQSHLHRNPRKLDLLSEMNPEFVRERVATCCGTLMDEYFPELATARSPR